MGDRSTLERTLEPEQIAWLLVSFRSRYEVDANRFISSPGMLTTYMDEIRSFFDSLPQRTNTSGVALTKGFVVCKSWTFYASVVAFLDAVARSLIFTPLFCLAAVAFIVRDVVVCYTALLTVAGMIVVTTALLHLLGTPLGPVESLALAVIIGVSIDYLIHLAFAYTNSMMTSRYYKSRAALLARSNSIVSAALTTLFSVLPLLGAKLLPPDQFGGP